MPALPSRPPSKINPRVDYRPEEFRKFIYSRGLRLTWEQAAECPCRRLSADATGVSAFGYDASLPGVTSHTTAEPAADCPRCGGEGILYHSAQEVRALISSSALNPTPTRPVGELALGEVRITTLPEHLPSLYDRFTAIDSAILIREVRVRTADTVEALRYPITTRTLDLVGGATTHDVLFATKADANGLNQESYDLVKGTDFEVSGGQIDWTLGDASGNAPAEGTRYSVSYYAHPRFIVTDHPYVYRDTYVAEKKVAPVHTNLPVLTHAKLDFLGSNP